MLYTIAVVLLILWALGLVTSYTVGGFIHVLLVIALVMVLINFISGGARCNGFLRCVPAARSEHRAIAFVLMPGAADALTVRVRGQGSPATGGRVLRLRSPRRSKP
jgi:hypothetical protein